MARRPKKYRTLLNFSASPDILLQIARASIAQYGTILPPREILYAGLDATCPNCGHQGKILTDFGFRTGQDGAKRPQSWCNGCRRRSAQESRRVAAAARRKPSR